MSKVGRAPCRREIQRFVIPCYDSLLLHAARTPQQCIDPLLVASNVISWKGLGIKVEQPRLSIASSTRHREEIYTAPMAFIVAH